MMTKTTIKRRLKLLHIIAISWAMACLPMLALPPASAAPGCPEIDDIPLETQIESSPPNIFFLLDDSGSMDWEYSTADNDGKLNGNREYLYDSPENFYDPDDGNGTILSENDRNDYWRANWAEFNKLYYDPSTEYKPWVAADGVGTNDPADGRMAPADMDEPKLHPTIFRVYNGYVQRDSDGTNTVNDSRNKLDITAVWKRYEAAAGGDALGIVLDDDADFSPDDAGIIIDNEEGAGATEAGIIIDDRDDGYTESGDWGNSSTSSNRYESNSRYTGDINDWASFSHQFSADEAGAYEIRVWFPCHDHGDPKAQYTVIDSDGSQTFEVDQNEDSGHCGDWHPLQETDGSNAEFQYAENDTGVVTLKRVSNADQWTYADAVKFVKTDDIPSYVPYEEGGDWDDGNDDPEWNSDSVYTQDNGAWAKWSHEFEADGTYIIQAWWPCDDDCNNNADFTITKSGGDTVTFAVNQRRGSGRCGQWVTIGDTGGYEYNAGDIGEVKLTHDAGNEESLADAVRFITQDQIDASYTPYEEGGVWDESSTEPEYGNSNRYTGTVNSWAKWEHQFSADDEGTYVVQGFWSCSDGNRDENALFTVTDDTDAHEVTMNQNSETGQCGGWVTIGEDYEFSDGTVGRVKLERTENSNEEYDTADAVRFILAEDLEEEVLDVIYAHYYVESGGDDQDLATDDDNSIYLVNLTDPVGYYQLNLDETPSYYKDVDNDAPELQNIADFTKVDTPPDDVAVSSYEEARQNFANWFTYYRRRSLLSIAAVSEVISQTNGAYIGLGALNSVNKTDGDEGMIEPLLPVGISGDNYKETLLTSLYAFDQIDGSSSTPMRTALREVGQYYSRNTNSSDAWRGQSSNAFTCSNLKAKYPDYFTDDNCEPINGAKGACQQNYTILFTDGYYNGGSANLESDDGYDPIDDDSDATIPDNLEDYDSHDFYTTDGIQISGKDPYEDDEDDTLADIAMKYYAVDLADDLDDLVPTSFPDVADHQHMVTYTISFGVYGNLNPSDYTLYGDSPSYPSWPTGSFGDADKIDDMWHAAVNGRGEFYSAGNAEELVDAFTKVVGSITDRVSAGASASVSSQELTTGSRLFVSGYNTRGWAGLVTAWDIQADDGSLLDDDDVLQYEWNAGGRQYVAPADPDADCASGAACDPAIEHSLESIVGADGSGHTNRNIATYDGSTGIAFSGDLSGTHADLTEDVVNYLRGLKTGEEDNGGSFRNRLTLRSGDSEDSTFTLGDIVHSSPVHYDVCGAGQSCAALYVGANDGMLHVFSASNGKELFAYVPALVHGHLKELTKPEYKHQYYVDATPTVSQIYPGADSPVHLLVGGLGKGGKGYFALDVSDDPHDVASDADAAAKVLWEFDGGTNSQHMGYGYSKPIIIETHSGDWAVVFGNGYGSDSGTSGIFILLLNEDGTIKTGGDIFLNTGTGTGQSADCNGMSAPFAADTTGNDGVADALYAGDLYGNMWKVDVSAESSGDWDFSFKSGGNPQPLFTAKDTAGNLQPITARPDVTEHCDGIGQMVVFGTGRYLNSGDMDDDSTQTLYGIWDYGDPDDDTEYVGAFNRTEDSKLSKWDASSGNSITLLEQTATSYTTLNGDPVRSVTANEANWATVPEEDGGAPNPNDAADLNEDVHAGWFFDLPDDKERITQNILIRLGRALVVSNVPSIGKRVCEAATGYSYLQAFDPCTGSRLDEAIFDTTGENGTPDGYIDSLDESTEVIDPDDPDETITLNEPIGSIYVTGFVATPALVSGGKKEYLYFGHPITPPEPITIAGKGEILYWIIHTD